MVFIVIVPYRNTLHIKTIAKNKKLPSTINSLYGIFKKKSIIEIIINETELQ